MSGEKKGHQHDHGGGAMGTDNLGLIEHFEWHLQQTREYEGDTAYLLAQLQTLRFEIDQVLPQIAAKLMHDTDGGVEPPFTDPVIDA